EPVGLREDLACEPNRLVDLARREVEAGPGGSVVHDVLKLGSTRDRWQGRLSLVQLALLEEDLGQLDPGPPPHLFLFALVDESGALRIRASRGQVSLGLRDVAPTQVG